MTVYNELNKIAYIGGVEQTLYPIPFEYISTEDIKVSVYTSQNEFIENWTYSTQYVIENNNVKILSGYEIDADKKLLILRRVDFVQDNQYREGGDFPAKSTETSLDKLTMITQQLQETLDRCVKVDVLDIQTPDELLQGVYEKLDTASNVATDAILAAEQATIAAEKATAAVEAAEKQIEETQEYVDEAKLSIDDAIRQATDDVKDAAVQAAEGVIAGVESDLRAGLQPLVTEAGDYSSLSRTWATGSDDEVQAVEPDEHSSRTYANFSMALANAPEDVPVLESTLLATDVVKGPKGDSGDAEFSGDVNFEGSFNVHGDDNHPVKVTSLAGASASGFQVVDSNGAGESDFEHAATGDRYITRIANKSTATGKTVNVDLYQTTAGKSVLDLSKPDTILAPALLDTLYPVGSIYITTTATCPLEALGIGTWELVAEDRVLQGAGTRGAVGTTVDESLPNITGSSESFDVNTGWSSDMKTSGAFTQKSLGTSGKHTADSSSSFAWSSFDFDASLSSSTYQDNAPVQPDAYLVNIFRRTM